MFKWLTDLFKRNNKGVIPDEVIATLTTYPAYDAFREYMYGNITLEEFQKVSATYETRKLTISPPPIPREFLETETEELEKKLIESLSPEGKQRVMDSIRIDPPTTSEAPVRPSWPETWMNVANAIAQRSYDPRLKVGAIIVSEDNTRVLSVGYNGNYKGGPNEPESLEPGHSGLIHAEQNALVKCDFNFPKKKHMYLTHSPCRTCAKLIINAEISRVIYETQYRDQTGIDLLKSAGVEVYSVDDAILKA